MVNISGIGQAQPALGTTRRAGGGGFSVSGQGCAVGAPAAAPPTAGLDGLLQLQEFEDAVTRDRHAKRQGQALLQALGDLQRLLLGQGPLEEALDRLSALVETCPEAADPALAGLVGGILLRARVELARRGR